MKEYSASEKKILEAALDVVNTHTISGTRMHLIAEEAGMSSANLHYHFKTKKELMTELLHYLQYRFSQRRANDFKSQPDTLEGHIRGFFRQKKDLILHEPKLDRAQFDFWTQGQIDPETNLDFLETFNIWRAHISSEFARYCPGLPSDKLGLVSEMMVSMMMGATMQYLNTGMEFHIDPYFDLCETAILGVLKNES